MSIKKITIRGAREHNLKNISLELPKDKMIVFTGPSGSGKSSLAFDTIFAEGQRRYIESLSAYARQFLGRLDKPDVDEIEGLSPAISIDQKSHSSNPRSTVATITEIYDYLRVLFARAGEPHCPLCGQKIRKMTNDEIVDAVIALTENPHPNPLPINREREKLGEIIIMAPVVRGHKGEYYQLLYDLLNSGFSEVRIDGKFHSLRKRLILSRYKLHTIEVVTDKIPARNASRSDAGGRQRLAEAVEAGLDHGNGVINILFNNQEILFSSKLSCPNDNFAFPEIEPRLFSFNSPYGACKTCHGLGTEDVWSEKPCPDCLGKRLRPESLSVILNGKNISNITAMAVEHAYDFFDKTENLLLQNNPNILEIAEVPIHEIKNRLKFLLNVGLNYLTLDRKAGTLSGGEAQRIRLASQIGSQLTGTLYVLDEPTIGLHQSDNEKLIQTLHKLRDLGNTIIVVEHDEDTIRSSDYLVDFGPAAGVHGGKIIAQGLWPDILTDPKQKSLTLEYLKGEKSIPIPGSTKGCPERRSIDMKRHDCLKIRGASENNLKNLNLDIPLRRFVAVTGVSGSGKSSLVYDVIYKKLANVLNGACYELGAHKAILGLEYLNKVINIDQSPIGRTPRSNPATYVGAWTHIRDLFAGNEEARIRGYKSGRFSFNVPGGRCEHCEGHGLIAIEMHFLPTVYVTCDVCGGKRFNRETLEVEYHDKNIYEILKMTVEEAVKFFRDIPAVYDKLKILDEVGLGYLELGQSATTLSGGEAQRVKIAAELGKRDTRRTMYLLDEPTTGLHFSDVEQLLAVLKRLIDRGNSVVVIEHNLDVIKSADWIIDLGPSGGERGGEVVAVGKPEDIARNPKSLTGKYLKRLL